MSEESNGEISREPSELAELESSDNYSPSEFELVTTSGNFTFFIFITARISLTTYFLILLKC